MRKYGFLTFFLGILLVGGALTVIGNGGSSLTDILPFLQQSSDPAAATNAAETWQTEQLFVLIVFIVGSMLAIGGLLAGLFWFLNRGVRVSKAEAEQQTEAKQG